MDSDLMLRLGTLAALAFGAVWIWRRQRDSPADAWRAMVTDARAAVSGLGSRRAATAAGVLGSIRLLSYALVVASTGVLAATGLVPFLALGGPLGGLSLVIHVSTAPLFAVSVTVASLLWSEAHVFTGSDSSTEATRKVCYWVLLVSAPVVIGSILMSMYPAFGTSGQRVLLAAHVVSTTVFLVVGAYHFVLVAAAAAETGADEGVARDGDLEATEETRGIE